MMVTVKPPSIDPSPSHGRVKRGRMLKQLMPSMGDSMTQTVLQRLSVFDVDDNSIGEDSCDSKLFEKQPHDHSQQNKDRFSRKKVVLRKPSQLKGIDAPLYAKQCHEQRQKIREEVIHKAVHMILSMEKSDEEMEVLRMQAKAAEMKDNDSKLLSQFTYAKVQNFVNRALKSVTAKNVAIREQELYEQHVKHQAALKIYRQYRTRMYRQFAQSMSILVAQIRHFRRSMEVKEDLAFRKRVAKRMVSEDAELRKHLYGDPGCPKGHNLDCASVDSFATEIAAPIVATPQPTRSYPNPLHIVGKANDAIGGDDSHSIYTDQEKEEQEAHPPLLLNFMKVYPHHGQSDDLTAEYSHPSRHEISHSRHAEHVHIDQSSIKSFLVNAVRDKRTDLAPFSTNINKKLENLLTQHTQNQSMNSVPPARDHYVDHRRVVSQKKTYHPYPVHTPESQPQHPHRAALAHRGVLHEEDARSHHHSHSQYSHYAFHPEHSHKHSHDRFHASHNHPHELHEMTWEERSRVDLPLSSTTALKEKISVYQTRDRFLPLIRMGQSNDDAALEQVKEANIVESDPLLSVTPLAPAKKTSKSAHKKSGRRVKSAAKKKRK